MPGDDPVLNLGGSAAALAMAQAGMSDFYKSTQTGMGQDTGQAGFFVPPGGPYGGVSTVSITAARAHAIRFVAPRSARITRIAFGLAAVATANDNFDLGIYDRTLTQLLGSTGATSGILNGSTGAKGINLQAPVFLTGGQVYYAAASWGAAGGTGAQICMTNFGSAVQLGSLFGSGAGQGEVVFPSTAIVPLPVPFTVGGIIGSAAVLALLEG